MILIFLSGLVGMQRWNLEEMLVIGQKLFKTIHKKKHYASPNHEVHFLARELKEEDDWLTTGIQSLIKGSYTPRYLKRIYFPDEMIDQLHLSDRILQHILLKKLKSTFLHVMNPNCYHLHGPGGVKLATGRIRQIIQEKKPAFLIRADIKSFYKSIPHHQLIQDVKKYYHDEKVRIVPHPRTLRKARENVKQMVADGVSLQRIRNYLSNWVTWWVRTSEKWDYLELLKWYLAVCRDEMCSVLAHSLIFKYKLRVEAQHDAAAAIIAV